VLRDFGLGLRLLGRGFGIVFRTPRLLLLGAIPALITSFLLLGGLLLLGWHLGDITAWLTPFAAEWAEGLRTTVRVLVGLVVFGAAILIGVVTFTTLTLLIGGPFYEHIAETVENGLGHPVPEGPSWLRSLVLGLRDSVWLILLSVLTGIPLFLAGFIPVVGQTVVPVLGVCVGGWLLALELVGVPFQRRGMRLGDRHDALRRRRALTLGLGVPAYLLCAIPFAAVVVMPAAVAGGTLLAHEAMTSHPAYR